MHILQLFSAPVAPLLFQWFSRRQIQIAAGTAAVLAVCLSGMAAEVWQVALVYGLINGMSTGTYLLLSENKPTIRVDKIFLLVIIFSWMR